MSDINRLIKRVAANVAKTWRELEQKGLDDTAIASEICTMIKCKFDILPEDRYEMNPGAVRMGETDGLTVYVRTLKDLQGTFTFFHEIAHVMFHYIPDRKISQKQEEIEADMFALRVCNILYPDQANILKYFARNNAGRQPVVIENILSTHKQILEEDLYEGAQLFFKEGPNYGYCQITPVIVTSRSGRNVSAYPVYEPNEKMILQMSDLYIEK